MSRIFSSAEELKNQLKTLQHKKKIVFTNGCFDILHPGHIYVLSQAATLGDILVVGINDDHSVRRLKGASRPVIDQTARAEVVASLRMVDFVVLFGEDTPYEIIRELRPDILVKGGEYGPGEVVGEDIVRETVRIKMKEGYSSTAIIDKIRKTYAGS